jgi:hypothetical protein
MFGQEARKLKHEKRAAPAAGRPYLARSVRFLNADKVMSPV